VPQSHTLPNTNPTTMAADATLELSIEQLISALDKKLFIECEQVQSEMSLISRALVPTLTVKVRSRNSGQNLRC